MVFIPGKGPALNKLRSQKMSLQRQEKITNGLLGRGWDRTGKDGKDLLVALVHPQAGPGNGEANSRRIICPRAGLGTTHGETMEAGRDCKGEEHLFSVPSSRNLSECPLACPSPAPPILPLYAVSQLS